MVKNGILLTAINLINTYNVVDSFFNPIKLHFYNIFETIDVIVFIFYLSNAKSRVT